MAPQSPPAEPTAPDRSHASTSRPLLVGAVIALVGVALAASLSWLHLKIEASGGAYTSFCNVNDTINCDRVLASPFAKLLGIPVANLALIAYAGLSAVFVAAARSGAGDRRRRSRLVRLAGLGTIGAVVFSAYMAIVSFFALGTICLMCSGLYAVALGLLATTLIASSRIAASGAPAPLEPMSAAAAAFGTAAFAIAAAALSWPSASGAELSADEIRTTRAEFYEWFTGLPVSTVPIPAGRGNISGAADAPVTIVEFFDFECAYCKINHSRLGELLERRPREVRVVYRHFPLDPACNEAVQEPIHARACRAAEAAECAGRQGKFTEMADRLFERQTQLFESNLPRIAELAGLDMDAFRGCMDDRIALADVVADCRAGAKLELKSTPTMFFNGRRVEGSINEDGGYDLAVTLEAAAADRARAAASGG